MQTKYISLSSSRRSGPLKRIATVAGMLVLGVVAVMFSAVLLVFILVAVAIGGAWLWWKTRDVRKQIREAQAQMRQMQEAAARAGAQGGAFSEEIYEGEVIEGVAVRVDESDTKR